MKGEIELSSNNSNIQFDKEKFIISIIRSIDSELEKYKNLNNNILYELYEKCKHLNFFIGDKYRKGQLLEKAKEISQLVHWDNEIKNVWYIYHLDFIIYEYEKYSSKHPDQRKFNHKIFTQYITNWLIDIQSSELRGEAIEKNRGIDLFNKYWKIYQDNQITKEKKIKIEVININEKISTRNNNLEKQIGFIKQYFNEYQKLYEDKEFKEIWEDAFKKLQQNHSELKTISFKRFNGYYKTHRSRQNPAKKTKNKR